MTSQFMTSILIQMFLKVRVLTRYLLFEGTLPAYEPAHFNLKQQHERPPC
uniref:Uncharacterized protein n=1 Tax=Kalanchoe fedtschenkoi TaxID=63787 RepID=A0A7N0SYY0_KALFE